MVPINLFQPLEENSGLTDLCIDTTLDGPAIDGYVFLSVLQLVTFGNPDHLLHQVQASNTLCDWMLHLKNRKHTGYEQFAAR